MTATYTFDVFTSLDGYGAASANWAGYWGKQGPELLEHRLALYEAEQRMVFGANTYRAFAQMWASSTEESDVRDAWVTRMRSMPTTVLSTTLKAPLDALRGRRCLTMPSMMNISWEPRPQILDVRQNGSGPALTARGPRAASGLTLDALRRIPSRASIPMMARHCHARPGHDAAGGRVDLDSAGAASGSAARQTRLLVSVDQFAVLMVDTAAQGSG